MLPYIVVVHRDGELSEEQVKALDYLQNFESSEKDVANFQLRIREAADEAEDDKEPGRLITLLPGDIRNPAAGLDR